MYVQVVRTRGATVGVCTAALARVPLCWRARVRTYTNIDGRRLEIDGRFITTNDV